MFVFNQTYLYRPSNIFYTQVLNGQIFLILPTQLSKTKVWRSKNGNSMSVISYIIFWRRNVNFILHYDVPCSFQRKSTLQYAILRIQRHCLLQKYRLIEKNRCFLLHKSFLFSESSDESRPGKRKLTDPYRGTMWLGTEDGWWVMLEVVFCSTQPRCPCVVQERGGRNVGRGHSPPYAT